MRMWRSVSDGVQTVGSPSKRGAGTSATVNPIAGGGVPSVLISVCSILLSRATYGHVSKLGDSGHLVGVVGAVGVWQHGCSTATRNGQWSSASSEAIPKSDIATRYATAARTISG
jgi:hypothetical protein